MKQRDVIGVVVILAAVILLTLNARAQRQIGAALAAADRSDAAVRTLILQRDSTQAVVDSLTAIEAAQAAEYSADSTTWAAERDAARLRADRAATSTQRLTGELRASLADSVQVALVDSLGVEHRRALVALTDEIQGLHEERASLWQQRETLGEIVEGLRGERDQNLAIIAEQAVEIAVLRTVVHPPLFNRILGTLVDPKLLTGLGVGVVIGASLIGP
jgi:hypothetical protein